jgi:hypothetical protein
MPHGPSNVHFTGSILWVASIFRENLGVCARDAVDFLYRVTLHLNLRDLQLPRPPRLIGP